MKPTQLLSLRKQLLTLTLVVTCFVYVGSAASVKAETTPPQTKCVTTATKKLKGNAEAQMEKDIALHSGNAAAATLIEQYRGELAMAWAAMEEPYCGFGSYGSKSAVKSYTKSVVRAREAFLVQVKKQKAAASVVVAPVSVEPVEVAEPQEKVVPEVPVVSTVKSDSSVIPKGLSQGMRSKAVTALQQKLVKHFKLSADASRVTGYYGPMTRDLVIQFQLERGIIASKGSVGAGQIGPKTAAALNALK